MEKLDRPSSTFKRKNPEPSTSQPDATQSQNLETSHFVHPYENWDAKSDAFYIEQTKLRSEIRIKEHREKPVDFFAKIWMIFDKTFEVPEDFNKKTEYRESYKIFEKLPISEFKELQNDIETHGKFKNEIDYKNYWESLLILSKFYLENTPVAKSFPGNLSENHIYKDGIDPTLEKDIEEFLESKKAEELSRIEKQISKRLVERAFLLDLTYWETILKRIKITKSKKIITEQYDNFVKRNNIIPKLSDLKENIEEIRENEENINSDLDLSPVYYDQTEELQKNAITEEKYAIILQDIWAEKLKNQLAGLKEKNKKEQEQNELDTLQATMRFSIEGNDYDKVALAMYKQEKERPMGEDEEPFNEPVQIGLSEDIDEKEKKFMLKKPLFFNRVKVGYEWNRYHQTHSDPDNPPPKIVQGYKFNLFYPHLIDRTKTPQFFLKSSDVPGTLIIRFHAGPPYEDVAFRILNKEWDLSEKRGFKCVFDRGILHLHFSFKKLRYKR